MSFSLLEIPANSSGQSGVTFVVTDQGVVVFTREYIRHVTLADKSPYNRSQVAWGGILTPRGEWVRRSFDFGGPPDPEAREFVTELIQKVLL
ncbi:MAG TPA: hypothetical protein VLM37_00710 [Fibrobacteraceae bacterium]|nr:hypothetical protein [Fibrobacteraceae bacterium]